MPENFLFKSEVTHDLPTYREFNRGATYVNPIAHASKIIICLAILFYLFQFGDSFYAIAFLVFVGILTVVSLIVFLVNRKGNLHYKRMLTTHKGQPPHIQVFFCEDGIHTFYQDGTPAGNFDYDQIVHVAETKNLMVLMLKYRLGLMVRKDTLTGGTVEQFTTFIAWHCRKWKAQKVNKGTLSSVLNWVIIGLLVVTLILAVCNLPSIRLFDKPSAELTNDMTYQEMADKLAPLGITISQQAVTELEEFDADYADEYGEEYYSGFFAGSKVYDLLYWEGTGFYDEETWEWTPSQSGVFYFDTEVMNVDSIYTDFFTGLAAMNAELAVTNFSEDYSNADLEEGVGTVDIAFDWNGTSYNLTAEYLYDWFDTNILCEVAGILAADGDSRDLYVYYDGQGCLLYYGTAEQLAQLESLTGLNFEDASSSLSYY